MPRVSFITPCYNAAPYIATTIQSVIDQASSDWEYIVVDDGSTDDSVAAARAIAQTDARVSVRTQENAGVAAARSAGVAASDPASDYLVFLDADDIIEPVFFDLMTNHLDDHPDVGLVYCGQKDIDSSGQLLADDAPKPRYERNGWKIREVDPDELQTSLDALVSRFEAIPSTCMFRRATFERVAGWRKTGVVEDKDMGMQMALAAPVHRLPKNLTSYRHHDGQRHLDRFYTSMNELHSNWWNDQSLDRADLERIRAAIIFDRRVAALLTRREATDAVRASEPKQAFRLLLRSSKQFAEAAMLTVRKRQRLP